MPIDDDKKKKPKKEKDDENPFGFDDDFFNQLNEQLRRMVESGQFPEDFAKMSEPFSKMLIEFLKQLNLDPTKMANMDPNTLREMMRKGNMAGKKPFIFGVNLNTDPNGNPHFEPFGNVKAKTKESSDKDASQVREPLVDIYEEDGDIVVVVEVPGVRKEDIELRASPNELEISTKNTENIPYKYHKIIPLPVEIDPDIAKARYQNGILELKMKKVGEKSNKKNIKIE